MKVVSLVICPRECGLPECYADDNERDLSREVISAACRCKNDMVLYKFRSFGYKGIKKRSPGSGEG